MLNSPPLSSSSLSAPGRRRGAHPRQGVMGGDWRQAMGMEDIRRCECLSVPFRIGCLLIFFSQDQLMTRAPTCQRCQSLRHECYGLPDRVCGRCQRDKKTCQDVVVEGKSPSHSLGYL